MTTVADAASVAAVYADRLLVGTTRDVHTAIARRVFGLTGTHRTPAGVMHDRIAAFVYGCVSLAARSAGHAGKVGLGAGDLELSPRGRRFRSVVNGLIGDVLGEGADPLAITPSVRLEARDVDLTSDGVGQAFPKARGRIALFLHGLCEDDECWRYKVQVRGPSYLDRLAAESDWTPLAVRFNSGLPIQRTAKDLAGLVTRLVDVWPRPVDEVALIGHSMGGLVARAMAAHAVEEQAPWVERVNHVVLLGCPHGGADLERLVNSTIPHLDRLPEVRPFGAILDERSVGIRNLARGIGVDTAVWPQATYHCVGATLGSKDRAIAGRVFGDLLVRLDSARGQSAGVDAEFRHIPGAHHFDLLNHPVVYGDLARWLINDKDPGEQ